MNKIIFLQYLIYFISTLGILLGLDLLLGAKITSHSKKTLGRTILDFDKIIIRFTSNFKKALDKSVDIDEKIINTKARIVLGFLFIAICVVMIILAIKA
jgi:hypothetical protein